MLKEWVKGDQLRSFMQGDQQEQDWENGPRFRWCDDVEDEEGYFTIIRVEIMTQSNKFEASMVSVEYGSIGFNNPTGTISIGGDALQLKT